LTNLIGGYLSQPNGRHPVNVVGYSAKFAQLFMELLTPSFGLIFWTLFSLVWFLLWLAALVHILRYGFKSQNEKLTWVVIILFVPFLGPTLYFLMGRKNKIKSN